MPSYRAWATCSLLDVSPVSERSWASPSWESITVSIIAAGMSDLSKTPEAYFDNPKLVNVQSVLFKAGNKTSKSCLARTLSPGLKYKAIDPSIDGLVELLT